MFIEIQNSYHQKLFEMNNRFKHSNDDDEANERWIL